jgi:hypothetical protein
MFRVHYSELHSHDSVLLQGLGRKLHGGDPEPRMTLSHASTEAVQLSPRHILQDTT